MWRLFLWIMRIVSGICGGRVITPPNNLRARPTTDFAKENLFNVLGNLVDFEDLAVLDLFAGTGSISYEFASRGAASVVAVEINAVHQAFIAATAKKLGLTAIQPLKANVFNYLRACSRKFDIIFADAPYDLDGAESVVGLVFERELLHPEGFLIFEHDGKRDFSGHEKFHSARKYGSVNFAIFQM